MSKIILNDLKVGDLIVDIDAKDTKGYGLGTVIEIFNAKTFFKVKFSNRELPVMFDQSFFRWDRAGRKNARRALTLEEFKKYLVFRYLDESCLDEELMLYLKKYIMD